ncbi:MAG: VWA domain-containing protein [Chloroflexi bacterium]|nr:VWA domain-containing protein [Chloroflexota bacterium]
MTLLAPLALLGLLFVPLILAFYMLRLRRAERPVSSTFLWQQLVRDVEANAPWQRLRRSLLLLLQLLIVLALVLVVARPFSERPAGLSRDVVLVLDASASMAAGDVFPSRLAEAKRVAIEALGELPADGRVSVVAAGQAPQLVANELSDRSRIASAIESVQQSTAAASLAEALRLADAVAARARGAEILLVTDDSAAAAPAVDVRAPVRVLTVGRDRHNQAIVALAVRADPSGLKRSVFVSVANLDDARVERRLQILADDVPFTARDLVLEPLTRAEVVIDELPAGARVVEARLTVPASLTAPEVTEELPDQLALDDAAWAVAPSDRLRRILLVGPGNVYLQNALSLLPNVELYGTTGEEYDSTTGRELFDLVVFDGYLPDELPQKPLLAIAPPASSSLGLVTGTLEAPAVGQPSVDEPLLRNVDLSRLHVAEAQRIELPDWARSVIPGPSEAPLLYAGLREGSPTAVLAFDLRQSDLPLQVAWPILTANLAGELLGVATATTATLTPGAPVELPLGPGSAAIRVTAPDGSVVELAPADGDARSVSYVNTAQPGIYRVEQVAEEVPGGTGATATGATSPPTPTPSPSPSLSPGASPAPEDPSDVSLFAVNLFDAEESNITPGNGQRLAALGGSGSGQSASAVGAARDEWWIPLALIALVVLMAEWLVYERDGARRLVASLRRSLAAAMPAGRRG